MSLWDVIRTALVAKFQNPSISITIPITETGYTKVRDVITLIDAILDTYDNSAYTPLADGTSFCNISVAVIAAAMGCKDFYAKTADEIVSFMSTNQEWSQVPIEKVQDIVNNGSLVIVGLSSQDLGQAHGHVAVCRPGKTVYSGKWGQVPRVLNIGAENYIARAKRGPLTNQPCGVNEAFMPLPHFYVWRNSL